MKGVSLLFLMLSALLQVEGRSVLHKYGAVTFTAAVTADVYDHGAVVNDYPFPASPVNVEIVSSSVADTMGGVGCSAMVIDGLNASYAIQTEIITLNGTTPVNARGRYLRLHTAHCITAGASQINVGNIDVRTTGGDVLATILAAKGQAQMLIYTVPAGKRLLIGGITWSWSGNPGVSVDCGLFTREIGAAWRQTPGAFILRDNVQPSPQVYTQRAERVVLQKTDIKATCTAALGTNVAVELFGVIADSN